MSKEAIDLEQIEKFAGAGLTIHQIASILRVPKRTFERWQSESEAIKEAIERGRSVAVHNVAATAYTLAVSGECPAMTMFYLKTRAGWREKHSIEITEKQELSKDQLKQIAKAMVDDEE